MTNDEVKAEIIRRGIEEVSEVYVNEPVKREGALIGFSIAANLETPEDFAGELAARRIAEGELRHMYYDAGRLRDPELLDTYFRSRWATLQIEHVYERMKVLWGYQTISARAAMQVYEIVSE